MIEPKSLVASKQAPLLEFLKKQQENKRFSNALEVTITLFIVSFFALFAIKPAVTTISSLVGEIKSKELMVTKMRGKINDIVAAQDSFAQVQERYQIIESALPVLPGYSHAAIQFVKAAAVSGNSAPSISFDLKPSTDKMPNIYLVPYGVSLGQLSGFQDALKLLDTISQNRRLIDIESVSFSTPSENSNNKGVDLTNKVMVSIRTRLYYWKQINEKK